MKVHNFNPGPSILPKEVLEKTAEAVVELNSGGMSLLEVSHRGKPFMDIMERSRSLIKELLNVPENYSVLFLQGGASLGFYISAVNFMKTNGKSAYVKTGEWAGKAYKEAKMVGNAIAIASSEDKNYSYIPKGYSIPSDADYLHLTSNNTIFGTQYKTFPSSPVPVLCDMSSDIFSRKIDASKFALIYAGAQKNMGPAGTTIYIVNKDLLGKTGRQIPSMLDLQIHIKGESMFNTPPVFAIYVCMLTLEWLKKLGGVNAMEKINRQKADLLYNEIDNNPLFKGTAAKEDRSDMNVTYILTNEKLKDEFDKMWKAAGINGLTGHRSVGGYRASIYNALPMESVQILVDVMSEFGKKFG
ncbi:MAG: 3-phosphoserine/phosphohydroxythreonine transaminase [Bacteroidota bacterium]